MVSARHVDARVGAAWVCDSSAMFMHPWATIVMNPLAPESRYSVSQQEGSSGTSHGAEGEGEVALNHGLHVAAAV